MSGDGYATPRWIIALAEMLDHQSYILKSTGRQNSINVAKELRQIADIIEQKI